MKPSRPVPGTAARIRIALADRSPLVVESAGTRFVTKEALARHLGETQHEVEDALRVLNREGLVTRAAIRGRSCEWEPNRYYLRGFEPYGMRGEP